MNIFLLPYSLIEELEKKILNSLWWGSKTNQVKGINWLRWVMPAIKKEFGGLGFRSLSQHST
uniref:Uncharacterized protein n=1 Tax=Cajanus cajan TaxID=3821 RepID=A0A151QXC0_CAJCA|nr:hypothetical protein KK1_044073 [Cajanus cajan]